MSYTTRNTYDLGASYTGKTLNAQIVNDAGVNVGSAITTTFREIANGLFEHVCSVPDGQTGTLRVYATDAPTVFVASVPLNPIEIEANAVQGEVSDALIAVGLTTTITGRIDATISSRLPTSSYVTPDNAGISSIGSIVVAIQTAVAALPSAAAIATAVWASGTRTLSSFGTLIADIWSNATRTLTAFSGNVSVVSAVDGGTISLYQSDTWRFTMINSALNLAAYESVAFVVKRSEAQTDDEAVLYLRSGSNGLQRIGGAAPVAAGNGTLTYDATSITVLVSIDETPTVVPGRYRWWLKCYDTTPVDDEGITVATGSFLIKAHGVRAVVG
jgi:hypothetical protein